MALISRVLRLFRADAHAVLDSIEEPEVLLKQSVREMEQEIQREQQSLTLLENEVKQLKTSYSDTEQTLVNTEEELNICFVAENNDLAKVLIRRKLEIQHFLKFLRKKRQSMDEAIIDIQSKLNDHRSRYSAMQQKCEILCTKNTNRKDEWQWHYVKGGIESHVRDEDVEIAFLREQQLRNVP